MTQSLLILTIVIAIFASPANAATCSTTCEGGNTISCTGDSCTASTSSVECQSTSSCGPGCTESTTTTKTCADGGGEPGPVDKQ